MNPDAECPCQSGLPFQQCCSPRIGGQAPASTAEQLMRSRYSAFACAEAAYIQATQSERIEEDLDSFARHIARTQWLGLRILNCRAGQPGDSDGDVEFVAFYRDRPGSLQQLHERSQFMRSEQGWIYTGGNLLADIKLGRNERCPCGSGKKVKQCCAGG